MKNWTSFLGAAWAVILFNTAASAQVAHPQSAMMQTATTSVKSAAPLSGVVSPSMPFQLPAALMEMIKKVNESTEVAQEGDLEARQGNWPGAVKEYQRALMLWPDQSEALYGLGDDSLQRGDVGGAVPYYRHAVYARASPDALTPLAFQTPVIRESQAFHVMEYARLLSLTGQQEEALTVYRRGVQMVDYLDGRTRPIMMLPDFGSGPGRVPFTPQRLQALAQVGWAEDHSDFDAAGAGKRLQQAVTLFPDSPMPYYYRARYAARHLHDFKAAKADFDRAEQLGDAAAVNAVRQQRHFFRNSLPSATTSESPQERPAP